MRVKSDISEIEPATLGVCRGSEKVILENQQACIISVQYTAVKEKRRLKNYVKLILRAFNNECDVIISEVNYKNITTMINRLERLYTFINDVSKDYNCNIDWDYYELKRDELQLVYEYNEKLYQEKEEQKIIREQIIEEERARKEFEKVKAESEKEAERYRKAILEAKKELETTTGNKVIELESTIQELEVRLEKAEENKRAISQAQITKIGHIYIISNIGSFGENIYKIGMTRRLDPQDRINELSNSSVPFKFDVHAVIKADNAPELELQIHKKLFEYKMNRINNRKEFFEITLNEIEQVLRECGVPHANINYTHEAKEFRQSQIIKLEQKQKNRVS